MNQGDPGVPFNEKPEGRKSCDSVSLRGKKFNLCLKRIIIKMQLL
jgi:hypothetical protein